MEGVIAAVPTAFNGYFEPVEDLFVEHCRWALANGCDGLNILGSTGEANSLDAQTRKTVMRWAADQLPRDQLMVGTGMPALNDTIAMTLHADELGYEIALVLPPFYYAPVSNAGLVAWYLALHEALGGRTIQIYFYNFPQMTGLSIPVEVIAELSDRAPMRFTGIKDSSGDLDYARAIVSANNHLHVFPSSETALATAHADGFAGCISATVNITCKLAAEIWSERKAPDQDKCNILARQRGLMAGPNLIPAIKYLVSRRVNDERWQYLMPPFLPLPENEGETLRKALEATES